MFWDELAGDELAGDELAGDELINGSDELGYCVSYDDWSDEFNVSDRSMSPIDQPAISTPAISMVDRLNRHRVVIK